MLAPAIAPILLAVALLGLLPGGAVAGQDELAARRAVREASSHAQAMWSAARAAGEQVAVLEARQRAIARRQQKTVAEDAAARRLLGASAARSVGGRRAVASGLVRLLATQRGTGTDPRSSSQAGLVAAAMSEPLMGEERERAAALMSLTRLRAELALLGTQRRMAEQGLDHATARAAQATALAGDASIAASEAGRRLALAEAGRRRAGLFALRLAQADELTLSGAMPPMATMPPAASPAAGSAMPLLAAPSRIQDARRLSGLAGPLQGEFQEAIGGADAGQRRRGATLVATRDQPVLAPREGSVAFAGRFRNFGLVLIIDHGHEYHSLMAGLSELWVGLGDIVGSGEPVGRLVPGADGAASLYYELRRGGEPVDPFPAMAGHEDKVRS